MQIKGVVSSIVYRNNENGYSILKVLTDGGEITATGKFPMLGEGEKLVMEGNMIMHQKYGEQFNATNIKIEKPTTCGQIIKYLSSGLISGVGPVTATNIVALFGEDTLNVIENEPSRLQIIKGISPAKALDIGVRYGEIKKLQEAVIFLQNYDVSINMAVKIYEKYKDKTEQVLTTNPYKLVEDIEGIGFRTADKIAGKMGVEADSTFRIRAGIVYCLSEVCEKSGSTLASSEAIIMETANLLNLDAEQKASQIDQVIANLIIDGYIKEYIEDSKVFYSLTKYFIMEKGIAFKLNLLQESYFSSEKDINQLLDEYERINNLTLHNNQREAVKLATNNGVAVITGGPGTGKTTIIKAICFVLSRMGLKTLLLAPTGRASKRLADSTGYEAKTIHRALDINFKGKEYAGAFNTACEVSEDVIIVDECSMVDCYVMYNLTKALDNTKRLILVGDKDQLPSVGAGNILDDLIKVGTVPVMHLTEIFRQAKTSNIVVNAHKINNGEMVDLTNKSQDFFVLNKEYPEENLDLVVELVKERLPKYLNIDSSLVQVIAPMKAGVLGVENLNKKLQAELNPKDATKEEVSFGGKLFRTGDRVMQTVNNYEQEWVKGAELGSGVFNGDIGFIEEINPNTSETTVVFEDGRRCFYSVAELDELMLSYAITIHKSQGSEFDAVIIPLSGGNPLMLNKNLLYTGVTRAKKMVVLVGSPYLINRMISNVNSTKRETLLKQMILNKYEF